MYGYQHYINAHREQKVNHHIEEYAFLYKWRFNLLECGAELTVLISSRHCLPYIQSGLDLHEHYQYFL